MSNNSLYESIVSHIGKSAIPTLVHKRVILKQIFPFFSRENEITFDDFAFYDSAMYKSFSQLLVDAMSNECGNEEFLDRYNLCFEVTLSIFLNFSLS